MPTFLDGGGECGALIKTRDWSETLGPVAQWSQSLKAATGLLLRTPVPIVMLWGEDGIMLYNDAYSVFAGGRHPELLGSKVREGWPEVADFNDHVMKVGLAGGTLSFRDQELVLHRHGRPENVSMNLDYSPVLGDDGKPAGVLAIVIDTTTRVAAERALSARAERLDLFDRLSQAINDLAAPDEIMQVIADFEHYPEWVDSMKSAEVLATADGRAATVRMVLDHNLVKDDYVLAYDWQPTQVSWHLVEGTLLKAMDGSYELTPKGAGTTVTYRLSVDVNLPMIGLFKRKAEKTIIDGALKNLKKRVEG